MDHSELEIVPPSALEVMERAQTDIQITTAKKYPRSMEKVKKDMLSLATLDTETAASCFYSLKRKSSEGDKIIQGPSARLAEIAVNSFGNIKAAARIISNDGKMITAQGVCHDLEKNVCISVEVKRRITGKNGQTFSDDMQAVTGNAACSIALRNAVLKVIPMALVKPVYEAAKKAAVGDTKTLTSRRAQAVKIFEDMGISRDRVFRAINKTGVEDIGLGELEVLIGMHTAIKDGDMSAEEAFPTFGPGTTTKPTGLPPAMFGAGAAEVPAPVAEKSTKANDARKLCAKAGISEGELLDYMRSTGTLTDEGLASLDEVEGLEPASPALPALPAGSFP